MGIRDLPTLAEVNAHPRATPKGKTRLQLRTEAKRLTTVDERQFRLKIWARDRSFCRCCGRKVIKTLARVAERGEIHHCHGRVGELALDDRFALLLCLTDHEKVTGRVNERVVIVPTATVLVNGRELTDCRAPVRFERVV